MQAYEALGVSFIETMTTTTLELCGIKRRFPGCWFSLCESLCTQISWFLRCFLWCPWPLWLLQSCSAGKRKWIVTMGVAWPIWDIKAHLHSDTLPPTWPHLLIVPLPMGQTFKRMSLWGPYLFKPPQQLWSEPFITATERKLTQCFRCHNIYLEVIRHAKASKGELYP